MKKNLHFMMRLTFSVLFCLIVAPTFAQHWNCKLEKDQKTGNLAMTIFHTDISGNTDIKFPRLVIEGEKYDSFSAEELSAVKMVYSALDATGPINAIHAVCESYNSAGYKISKEEEKQMYYDYCKKDPDCYECQLIQAYGL